MSDVVLVLGMLGGEDKIVAGVMSKLGCALPKSSTANASDSGSSQSTAFAKFHDELLASAGTAWKDWRQFNPEWYKSSLAGPFKTRAKTLFTTEFGSAPLTLLADPRVSRFAPFWLDVFSEMNVAPHILMPIQSPLEVARGLNETHGVPLTQGLLMWLRHMLTAEAQTRTKPRSIFGWADFIPNWHKTARQISNDFSLAWPRMSERSDYEIEQFLKINTLKNNEASCSDPANQSDLHKWTLRAYNALLELASNPLSNSARIALDQVRELFEQSSNIFGRTILDYEIALENAKYEQYVTDAAVKTQLLEARQDLASFHTDLALVEQTLSDKDRQLQDLNAKLSAIENEKLAVAQQLRALQQQFDESEQTLKASAEATRKAEQAARDNVQILEDELTRARLALGEMSTLDRKLASTEAKLRDQEAECQALRLRAKAADEEKALAIHTAHEEATKERQKFKVLKQSLDESLEQRQKLEQLQTEQHQTHIREITQAQSTIADFEKNLAATQEKLSLLDGELANAQQLITAKAEENMGLRNDIASLQHNLEEHAKTVQMHAGVFKQLDRQSRAMAIKRAIERELESAARSVRRPIPFGLTFSGTQLRSPNLPKSDFKRKWWWERRELARWGLFEPSYYIAQNPDVATAGIDAFTHFFKHGILEDRDPHPLFNSGWYRIAAGARLGKMPPLFHYLRFGQGNRLSPHPLFDSEYYLDKNEDVARQGADPFMHFRNYGASERRDPHPLIWMNRLATQSGFENSNNFLLDYLTKPELFKSSPHPLFDGEAYLSDNKDVAKSHINPLLHYCAVGWREGRQPHGLFSGDWYLAKNPDVLASGMNPLCHYVRHGWLEQRDPHPLFDTHYYYKHNREARKAPYDPLSHYVMNGAREGRQTSNKVSLDVINAVAPSAHMEKMGALAAFLHSGDTQLAFPAKLLREDRGENDILNWPPTPEPPYCLPQRLRDYIVERYDEKTVPLYLYLMSLVERYGDEPDAFAVSNDLTEIVARLHKLVAKKSQSQRDIDVSVVIPAYNNLVFTLTCVLSILENEACHSYEILIGDDVSTDGTQSAFTAIGAPIQLIRHTENLGFLNNCNHSAEFARGRNIALLNNDTLTLPGWLDELIEALESSKDVGLAGSKLINADGTLQEAGGIFWRDGTAWNFGRGDNASLPQYNYRKEVDYISGASIALPAALWRRLRGFDPAFSPAYCEDADLAFRVRKAGLRTLYAPHSELVHHEGKSHGTDTTSGVKTYQAVNQQKLFARWKPALESQHFFNGEDLFVARDRSRDRPHILFVDHYVPQWDRDAGSRTMFHFLRMFVAAGFQVSFWPANLNEDRQYCEPLQKMGIEVLYSVAYIDQFHSWIKKNGAFFDYALVSRPHIAIEFYSALRAHTKCKILYYGHDIHHWRMELERATKDSSDFGRAIEKAKAQEFDNWSRADVILYPSSDERDAVRATKLARRAEQVPMLGFLPSEFNSARKNLVNFDSRNFNELLFVGGSHPPNVDALLWFAREVLPLILKASPKTRLNVVGATTNSEVMQLESEAIVLHGRISDTELETLYANMGISVVPLRFGAGVKGKTVEALLNAIPIVSTDIGMQGLVTDEPIAFVVKSAEALANAVLEAQSSPDDARSRVERGLAFVERAYSIDALRLAFAGFVPELRKIDLRSN